MKYLDEQIEIEVTFGSTDTSQAGVYTFYVYEYNIDSHQEEDEIIFVGNYYNNGFIKQTFNITDIVRNRRFIDETKKLLDNTSYLSVEAYMLHNYSIKAFRGSSSAYSSWLSVAMVWRYPNVSKPYTTGNNIFTWGSSAEYLVRPCLQGYNTGDFQMVPHYPKKITNNFKYAQTFVHTVDNDTFHLWGANNLFNDYITISPSQHDPLSTVIYIPLDEVIDWQYYEQEIDMGGDVELSIANYDDTGEIITCGIMDTCYKRYYLQWQDRFGGYQCQAFNDITKFSIDYKVTETQTYTNERNKSFISAQPKWKLSSGWIKEDFYPYYESIFVSPHVILYDTQEDVTYNVFVTGNWTEKKFKNEKKLLNISLDLELKTKQNIIY